MILADEVGMVRECEHVVDQARRQKVVVRSVVVSGGASRVFGEERGRCARGGEKPRVFSAGTVLAMQSTKRAYHSDKLRGVCERKGE